MASLKDIRRRISAVRGTQKVTRAMKLVAAAKLKRAQQMAYDMRASSRDLHHAAKRVSRRLGVRAPLLWRRPEAIDTIDIVVITSDRGLCGGFNENLLRIVDEEVAIAADHNISAKLFVLGKKGQRYFKVRGVVAGSVPPGESVEAVTAWIRDAIVGRFLRGESAGAVVAFNRFRSTARYEPTFWNLLPLHSRGDERERHLEYLYEPARPEALDMLCRMALESSISQAIVDSTAAELAARMAAMDNATKNADDMIGHLTFVYNRARQESITRELMDIVGGAEALK